jgi:cytochrome c biogenesis protein CcmG/thiol:disulfide interchange protein DsbE
MAGTTKKQPQSPERSRSILIGGVVVVIVAIVIFVVFSDNTNTVPDSEFGEPQVQGQLSSMPPDVAVDTSATGETAPIVIGADFAGNEVRIESDGRAKAIVLLAHWCPHCQNEVPEVQAWLDAGGGVEGVDMYSVATSMNSTRDNYPASEWLDREGWTVPVIVDDQENSVYISHGAGGFPFWVFVNSDGTVGARAAGRIGIDQLEQFMNGLS